MFQRVFRAAQRKKEMSKSAYVIVFDNLKSNVHIKMDALTPR